MTSVAELIHHKTLRVKSSNIIDMLKWKNPKGRNHKPIKTIHWPIIYDSSSWIKKHIQNYGLFPEPIPYQLFRLTNWWHLLLLTSEYISVFNCWCVYWKLSDTFIHLYREIS